MPKVIASTYKIVKKIGSGGGGNVYLAEHLRLGKMVVLKADKRKLSTRPELLRREVDVLKDLRHAYIPKVYDFFVEDNVVYTAMDFIEGESLDKPLKRGERFSQPQVIAWAKQLLEALCYLHSPIHGDPSKGYVHSDIKPANLMRTPQNDICLIDFNIALALGEENIVGRSAGYASPEHYGLDYSKIDGSYINHESESEAETETEEGRAETVTISEFKSKTVYKKIVPDVRSDIYSVGATLYHLLSGKRPAKFAVDVIPLSDKEFSPQIVEIISKAMNPNPNLRYQTADEMLNAFLHLKKNDPRTKRWKRRNVICSSVITVFLCVGIMLAFIGLKRMQAKENDLKLAEYSENAFEYGDIDLAIKYALDAAREESKLITPETSPEAQKALTDALEVYDLADGFKKSGVVKLEKNPLYLKISPDGMTAACIYENEIAIIAPETMEIITVLQTVDSALAEVEYLNSDTIVYAGEKGISVYSITREKELWTGEPATAISVSSDGSTVAAIYKNNGHAVIYDALTGTSINEIDFNGRTQSVSMASDDFANPYNNVFAINEDGSLLAVSFSDGSLSIFDLQKENSELKLLDEASGYTYFEGDFSADYFAFSASDAENSIFAIIDGKRKKQSFGLESENSFHTQTDENNIYVQIKNVLVKIDPISGEQTPLVTTDEIIQQFVVEDMYSVIATQDKIQVYDSKAALVNEFTEIEEAQLLQMSGNIILSARIDAPVIHIMKYKDNSKAEVTKYDSAFGHDEARISKDEKTVMLFSYKQFSIWDMDGNVITKTELPDPEQIYDQQFIRDEEKSCLEVFYNDGRIMTYDAGSGELLSESLSELPDMTLNEEFHTEDFRVEAPLHGTPQVYVAGTDKKIGELKEDAYLTYITQVNDKLIAQYINADGFRYGILWDSNCKMLAYLPYLSDIKDNELYFDYYTAGTIRKSDIYDLDTLIKMGEEKIYK